MQAKKKTSLGTWAAVVAIIVISVASAAYTQHQKAEVKREIDAKYPAMQITPNDIDGCIDGAECYTTE